jgi:formate dehydrogenase iron-sulfur subunit
MKEESYYRPAFRLFDGRTCVLIALMAIAAMAAGYRFIQGLGATTNLSDQFPWGLWVAFDVICGVALAAGGFTTAAAVYIFMEEKYHGLVRPAILTALLGYVFVAVGLLVDLGKPWNIWHPIIYWPKHSALFEVAWCVMLYLSVLALEFAPVIFERFGWTALHALWRLLVPPYVIFALTFFTYIMSHSIWWTVAAFVAVTAAAVFAPGLVRSRPGVPIILIIAGIIFSTAHQSSLGTLFLLMPDKLHPLWWTPLLPVNFFLSAVAVGFAMVIFEATFSARAFGLPDEKEALTGLSKYLAYALFVYLGVRIVDIVVRGQLPALFSVLGMVFLAEVFVGIVLPLLILLRPEFRASKWWRFSAASLVIFGLVWNRFSATLFAMHRPGNGWYFPSVEELVVSVGIVSAIIFFYNIAVKLFPVLPAHEDHAKRDAANVGQVRKKQEEAV